MAHDDFDDGPIIDMDDDDGPGMTHTPRVPTFAHRWTDIEKRVYNRRQKRKLIVSRLCKDFHRNVKNHIWRFLPDELDDGQRERMLWFVKQADYEVAWMFDEDNHCDLSRHNPRAWRRFLDDPEVMTACMSISRNSKWLFHCTTKIMRNKEVVLASVTNYGLSLKHAHKSLQRDVDVVLQAVKNDGHALEFAHSLLKRDKAIVLAAVSKCGMALGWSALAYDDDVAFAAVTQDPQSLQFMASSATMRLVHYAVSLDGAVLSFVRHNLKDDPILVITAVSNCGHALEYASWPLRDDLWVVSRAVTNCWRAILHASSRLAFHSKVQKIATRHCNLCETCRMQTTSTRIREDWKWYFPERPIPAYWGSFSSVVSRRFELLF